MPQVPPGASSSAFSAKAALWPAAVLGIVATGTAYIAANNPHISGALGACPLYGATGLFCPGCGGTRAVYELAHGDVLGALAMNPLFTLAVPLLVVLWVRWLLRTQGVAFKPWPFPVWLGFVIPGVIVTFAVLRNIDPFAAVLSPT